MTTDVWADTIGIAGLVVNGVGLTFLAVQVSMARRSASRASAAEVEEWHRRKQQATLDHVSTIFDMIGALWREMPDDFDSQAVAEFCERAKEDPAARDLIQSYLSQLEIFAAGVSAGIYDLDMADSVFGSRLMAVYRGYAAFIQSRRVETGAESLFRELEWIAQRISELRGERSVYLPLARRTENLPRPTVARA